MLNSKLLHIRESGASKCVYLGPPEFRPINLEHSHASGNAGTFFEAKRGVPLDELVADFDFPSHKSIMTSE